MQRATPAPGAQGAEPPAESKTVLRKYTLEICGTNLKDSLSVVLLTVEWEENRE